MKKLLQSLFILMLVASAALAQDRTVTGTVSSKDDGQSLPGVSVKIKGLTSGTQTSADGKFSIQVPANSKVLVFTYVGFKTQTLNIPANNQLKVSLELDATALNEVVVMGYGTQKKLGSVVGSVAVVSSKAIENKPIANPFDALQGKVAGLQVFTPGGEPSQTSSIRLHGVGSLGASSTPLYLLDGVPTDGGTVISLNPNDIENISVLKDASATSIYGARAANGVIYVTTKRGQIGKPAEIRVTTQYGTSSLANDDYFNSVMNTKQFTDFRVASGQQTQAQVDATLALYPNDTKWYKVYYKNGAPTKQTDVSISGGSGKTSYYVSGGFFEQEGLAYRSNFKRTTLRSNLNTAVNDWISLGLNLSIGTDDRQLNPYGSNSTNRGIALLAAPYFSPYGADGQEIYGLIPGWARYAPKYLADKIQSNGNNLQFNPSGYIQINPFKGLTFKVLGGYDAYDYRTSNKQLPSYIGSINNGNAYEGFDRSVSRNFTNTLEYKWMLGAKNNFTALLGQEYSDNTSTSFSGQSTGQSDDRLTLIPAGASNLNASSSLSEFAFNSYFGRLEYNYNNRYFLDVSVRQDASSRFGALVRNNTARFWSVGGMWKAKQENFLKDVKWLNDLTFRASTGTAGNSGIGNYDSQALVGTNINNGATGWFTSSSGNSALSWETQQKTTFGVKTTMFNSIRLDIEYYKRDTKNMLISVPYAYTSGFSSITSNVGTLTNTGVDITLDFDVWTNTAKKAYITPYANVNMNKDKITELFQGKSYWIIPNTGVSWAVGQSVSYFYPIWKGVNPANGLPTWYQPNTDPNQVISTRKDDAATTNTFAATLQQSTGLKRYPWLNGGFGLSAGFQNVSFQADFSFSKGKYMINNDRYFSENPSVFPGFNQRTTILDYWKAPGDVTTFPGITNQFTQFDSRLIEDASFLRLKSLAVGYALPASVLKASKFIKGMKFSFTGRNLLTFTKYTGPDPEVDSNIGFGTNPNTKQYTFGLDLKF